MTFLEAVADLLAHLRLDGYSPETIRTLSNQLQAFGEWLRCGRIRDLRAVTRAQVEAYQAHVNRESLSPGTRALRVRAVRRLYRHLVEAGDLLLDPCDGIPVLRRPQTLPRPVLTLPEMQRLLAAPNVSADLGIRDRAWLEVLYATGARIGELEGICLSDLDRALSLVQLRHTKGGEPRVVPLGHHAAHWLRCYLDEVRPRLVRYRPFERALFVVQSGRPLGQNHLRDRLRVLCKTAGICKAVSPHLLRHSCATHLLRAGADIRAIQELLGHHSLSTTVIYTRVAAAEVKAMHERYHPGNDH